jgi:AcrR family transcriptional regulator
MRVDRPKPPAAAETGDRVVSMGRRERGKVDKRRRIVAAARTEFSEKGYDVATLREIAERADVAIGTLFIYATNKRDLLMMIVNDELDEISKTPQALPNAGDDLVDDLLAFFRQRYAFWVGDPELARAAMREMNAPYVESSEIGIELLRGLRRRAQIVECVAHILRTRSAIDNVTYADDLDVVAWFLTDIYLSEVRLWLNDERPTVDSGIGRLRRMFLLATTGVVRASHRSGKSARAR